MLDPYSDPATQCARERHADLMREIELARLFDEEEHAAHLHERALSGAGSMFVALGRRLQQLGNLDTSARPALR